MPAPVAAAPAPLRAGRTTAAPFTLSRPQGTIRGEGELRRFDDAAHAVRALRSGEVGALTGAIPFDVDQPAAVVEPRQLWRSGTPWRGARGTGLPECRVLEELPTGEDHLVRVEAALARLRDDSDPLRKVVLARQLRIGAAGPVEPEGLLHRLVTNDPAGNGYCVDLSAAGTEHDGQFLVGSSPEVLVRKEGRIVTCHPLAGSAARAEDPTADWEAGRTLGESTKDLREHRYVVDAIRRRLEPVSSELDIPARPTLTHTPQLWHLGTPIRAVLHDSSLTALDLALALHPTPAVCGTPTREAFEAIRDLEGAREFYAGAVGWCDERGDGEWMVAIRCARIAADGSELTAYAGGGIVAESVARSELSETTTKFGTVLDSLGIHR